MASSLWRLALASTFLTTIAAAAAAQTVSGSIAGTVVDQTAQMLPAAAVTLIDERTGTKRAATTNDSGGFVFTAVQPGTYTVRVEIEGFGPAERTSIVLPAGERLSLGDIALNLGGVTEVITTTAQGSFVQATSSERSAMLTSKQIEMLSVRGRDVMDVLTTLPGVQYRAGSASAGGGFGSSGPNIGGGRNTWNTMTVDGLTGNDLGSPEIFSSTINFDAISEVKVQLNNYQAEHGRNAGAVVNIVTKSGTREFKGSTYWYKRHEQFNANDFFNNRDGRPKPLYRYNTVGVTFGGPVALPRVGGWGDKLFFFYSFEDARTRTPQAVRQVTVPTELERRGDFSQSFDPQGRLIVIRDPVTNQPFQGNRIPDDRINPDMRSLLNIFPQPNSLDRSLTGGNYNYQFQESVDVPKRQHVGRVDYRPSAKDSFYAVVKTWYADNKGYAVPAGSSNWGLVQQHYTFTDDSLRLNYTRIFSPTIVNEMSFGARHSVEDGPPLTEEGLDGVTRARNGFNVGQFTPDINPLGIIPRLVFGTGVNSPADITYDGRFPLTGADTLYSVGNTLTVIKGDHTLKTGLFFEHVRNEEGRTATFAGEFNFQRDVNNPLDTNYPYATALLGNFRSYTESTSRPGGDGTASMVEWFAQDTWKLWRRVTLDYGMRLGWYTHYLQKEGQAAAFSVEQYDRARASRLYEPVLVNGQRFGRNPVTGETVPAVLIGAIVPGTGELDNGMLVGTDASTPRGFKEAPGLLVEPRVGFAWDLRGDGRTAVRGGFGIFHNPRSTGNNNWNATRNPPLQYNPQVYYGSLDTLFSSPSFLFPSNVLGFELETRTPRLYNYSIGLQHDIGWGTVVDVAYVGSRGERLLQYRNLNTVPYGARFDAANQDPTQPGRALPDNFFRPFPGYGNVDVQENSGRSRYHALQVQANRRFTRGLQFGLAYTWAQSKDTSSNDVGGQSQLATYRDVDDWNWGLSGYDQTHVAIINYTWDLPDASRLWGSRIVKALLDDWQLSGITAFASGTPAAGGTQNGIMFTTTDGVDFTGGGDGTRIGVTGDPTLGRGDRGLTQWFDTSVFRRPVVGEVNGNTPWGNPGRDIIRGPGVHNWDVTLFKNIPFSGGRRFVQLRWEIYNVFNHTQFDQIDREAIFDAAGNQIDSRFGQVISVRSPRQMQLGLRLVF